MKKIFSKIQYFFAQVEFFYLALIPYLGYIGTGLIAKEYVVMPFLGIGALMAHQVLALGFWKYQKENGKKRNYLFAILPTLLIAINYILLGKGIWLFFIEKAMIEVGATMLSFSIALLFFKNSAGRTSWQDIGGIAVLVILIIVAGMWEMVKTWWLHNPYFLDKNYTHLAILALALALDFWRAMLITRKVAEGKAVIGDIFETKYGLALILVQVGIWVIVIPAVVLLFFVD
jgi:hypothetical protein